MGAGGFGLTEGLVARGIAVTLFATADSITATRLRHSAPMGYAENTELDPKVEESFRLPAAHVTGQWPSSFASSSATSTTA